MLSQVPWVHARKIQGLRGAAVEGDVACRYAEWQVYSANPATYTTVRQYPKLV